MSDESLQRMSVAYLGAFAVGQSVVLTSTIFFANPRVRMLMQSQYPDDRCSAENE